MAVASDTDSDGDLEGDAGLDDEAAFSVVSEIADVEGYQRGKLKQRRALAALYSALIRRDAAMARIDLRPHFVPAETGAQSQGLYRMFDAFYSDVGRAQLCELPGIEETADGFRFVGVDPDDVDAETRPLSELRADPRTKARNHIEDTHGPTSDATADLLALFDQVADAGETTTADMAAVRGLPDPSEYAAALAGVPHIDRSIEDVTAEDIRLDDLETLADLEAARERVASDPVERWTYTGG